jgi:hypothetical protein
MKSVERKADAEKRIAKFVEGSGSDVIGHPDIFLT